MNSFDNLSSPRSEKTQKTKDKIYKAAIKLLQKKGYEYLTVKNICEVSGVSNGTFFYHFKTKEDLLSYYLIDRFQNYLRATDFYVTEKSFKDTLINYYENYVEYSCQNGIEFISSYYVPKNKALNSRAVRGNVTETGVLYGFTTETIHKAQEVGILRTERTAIEYANNCCTIVKGIIFEWALTDGAINALSILRELIGAYLDSIIVNNDIPFNRAER